MQNEINNEWTYEQSPSEVWAYLTQADLIALWLMPNDFRPVLGTEFQFRTKPIPSLDLDGIFHCNVLELIPFEKLRYTWKGGSGNGLFTLDTVVEWRLEKHGAGTKLFLKQWGFEEVNLPIFTAMTEGWQKNVQKMMNFLIAAHENSTNS